MLPEESKPPLPPKRSGFLPDEFAQFAWNRDQNSLVPDNLTPLREIS